MKKVLKTITLGIAYSCLLSPVQGQDSLTLKLAYIAVVMDKPALHIGDDLPAIQAKVYNYPQQAIQLGDLKGKIVILHFWHQYCSYCVAQFQKLDSLQKIFSDKLVILPVTFQSEASVKDFYVTRSKLGKPILLPSIVEDTTLRKLFPHSGDPHDVWINPAGKVEAITEFRQLTFESLSAAINAANYKLPERRHQFDFDPMKTFLVNNNGGPAGAFIYRSMFTHYVDSIDNNGLIRLKDKDRVRLFLANAAALDLYKSVYTYANAHVNFDLDYLNKRVLVESKNKQAFAYWPDAETVGLQAYEDYLRTNVFCYELILPPAFPITEAYSCMIADLDRFFKCSSAIETREIEVLNLSFMTSKHVLKTTGGKSDENVSEDNKTISVQNGQLKTLVQLINMYIKVPMVIDKTGYQDNVDIELHDEDLNSYDGLKSALKKFGLALSRGKAEMPVLVLKD